jgi:ParB-like chromosome segregation protein Spo0J
MITEKRELKNVPLADLIPYARNPRKNDPAVQRVAASLKEYGLVKNSIVVDEDMVLITGHTTTKAMQALKWATAPEVTQVFGLTEAQKKAYRIADNKLGELAAWDDELLALELDDLKVLDFDLDLTSRRSRSRLASSAATSSPSGGTACSAVTRRARRMWGG